jgi:SAM-dependent methyltransferase
MKNVSNNYGDPVYWERKYAKDSQHDVNFEAGFDLYCPFEAVFPIIDGHINHTIPHRVLIIGVGRSDIIDVLLAKNFKAITAIDTSPIIISKLLSKYHDEPSIDIILMDVTSMAGLTDKSYTLVIDKGCIDCLFCGIDYVSQVRAAYKEVYRVLRPLSTFFSISHAMPTSRVPYLRDIDWEIQTFPMHVGESLFLYVAAKTSENFLTDKGEPDVDTSHHRRVHSHDMPVVSTINQSGNKCPRFKTSSNKGILTVTSTLQELRALIEDSV